MANIVIVTSGTNIDVNFGVYGNGVTQPYESRYDKGDIIKVERFSDYVHVKVRDEQSWFLVYVATENYLVVDLVDAVAPTSLVDLYAKIKALM